MTETKKNPGSNDAPRHRYDLTLGAWALTMVDHSLPATLKEAIALADQQDINFIDPTEEAYQTILERHPVKDESGGKYPEHDKIHFRQQNVRDTIMEFFEFLAGHGMFIAIDTDDGVGVVSNHDLLVDFLGVDMDKLEAELDRADANLLGFARAMEDRIEDLKRKDNRKN